jgi:hypothetical protein
VTALDPREQAYRQWAPPAPHKYKASKLTAAQRDEIGYRRMEGERAIDLALEYGVSRRVIDMCVSKERP